MDAGDIPEGRTVILPHADAWFRTGSAHDAKGAPCQDWATAGHEGDLSFGLVSDGCSTSGRTDLGSRIVGLSAGEAFRSAGEIPETDAFREAMLGRVASARDLLRLEEGDLDATLLACFSGGGTGSAFLFGDGLAVAGTAQGIEAVTVEWAGNMPAYPAYMLSPSRRDLFVRQSRILARDAGQDPCTVTRHLLHPDGTASVMSSLRLDADEGLRGIRLDWTGHLDFLAVMTDGALQFGGADWSTVVGELTAFRTNRCGEFVRRRMAKGLGALARKGFAPIDDVAMAALAAGTGEG